jgi:hypothetical protein
MLAKIMVVFVTAAALAAGPTADAFAFSGGVRTWLRTRPPVTNGPSARSRYEGVTGAPILTEFPDLSTPRSSSAEENLVPHYSDDGGSK